MTVRRGFRTTAALLVAAVLAMLIPMIMSAVAFAQDYDGYPDEASAASERTLEASGATLLALADDGGMTTLSSGRQVIAIDAGHGTDPETGVYDCGAIGYGFHEATANQWIADACIARLNAKGITTLTVPQYRSVTQRVDWAVAHGATMYISLHNNSTGTGDGTGANGFEVWIQNSSSFNYSCYETGVALFEALVPRLSAVGLNCRYSYPCTRDCTDGERYSDGRVADYYSANYEARQYGICGIIIEHAFINNYGDNCLLRNQGNCEAIGQQDAEAIASIIGPSEEDIQAFVTRMYSSILNREPDSAGFEAQCAALRQGASAAELVNEFCISPEFQSRNLTNAERVACVYRAMLDREPDSCAENFVAYFNVGMSITGVVAGISGSQEFTEKCEVWGIAPGSVEAIEARDVNYAATAYVYRLYSIVLNREPERQGLNDQCQGLLNGMGAGQIAQGFLCSPEFSLRELTNEQRINQVYLAMLDRNADDTGLEFWGSYLDMGMSMNSIIAGLCTSQEFNQKCASWGVNPGSVAITEARDANYDVTAFVQRLYSLVLGREAETKGLNDNCAGLLNGLSASDVAWAFFKSEEFANYQFSNEEIVTRAYEAMLDRDPDADGFADWLDRMDNGMPLYYLIAGFVNSQEFTDLCASYGINRGSLAYDGDIMESYSSSAGYSIMGTSSEDIVAAMSAYYVDTVGSSAYPSSVFEEAPTIDDYCRIVYEEATAEGVRADVVFCQAMLETGYLRYGGQVEVSQRNFCGLKTSDGSGFATFESVRIGVRAHVQHLKAYASVEDLANTCVDPRFSLIKRGCAKTVEELDGKWCVPGDDYGERIVALCKVVQNYM